MSRMGFIKRNPKRALSSLAVLMLAVGLVGGSGAFFQSSDANNNSTVSTGNIAIETYGDAAQRSMDARTCTPRESSNPGTTGGNQYDGCYNSVNDPADAADRNGAIFEISNLEPGQVVEKQVRVKNAGSLDADTFLKLTNVGGDADLFNALYIYVKNVSNGHTQVYSGPLSQMDDQWFAASGADTLAQNENDMYAFAIKLPETGVDQSGLMSKTTSLQFTWLGRDQGAPSPNTVAP